MLYTYFQLNPHNHFITNILLPCFTVEKIGMRRSNLPKITEPVSEFESRVYALDYLLCSSKILVNAGGGEGRWGEEDGVGRGEEIFQAEGKARAKALKSGRTWFFWRREKRPWWLNSDEQRGRVTQDWMWEAEQALTSSLFTICQRLS